MSITYLSQKQLKHWIPPFGAVVFTDLDECAINSDHRRKFSPKTGELDIPRWHHDSTPELIAQDKLTPWGERFAVLSKYRVDCIFGICTSREFIDADYELVSNRLGVARNSGLVLHREFGCMDSREALKEKLFLKAIRGNIDLSLAVNQGKFFFFDDKIKNVLAANALGINGILVY